MAQNGGRLPGQKVSWPTPHKRRWVVLVLALVTITALTTTYDFQSISSALARTESFHNARQLTSQMVEALFKQESSLRGYTSTRDPEYLRPFESARGDFNASLEALGSNLDQLGLSDARPYLRDISRIHGQWVDTVASPLISNPSGELSQSRQRTGELLFSSLNDDVAGLAATLDAAAQTSARESRMRVVATVLEVVVITLVFVFTAIGMYGATRQMERRYVAELTEANTSLVNAQRLARVGNWTKDLRTGKLTWSEEMRRIFDVAPHEIDDALLRRFDHPSDVTTVKHVVSAAQANFEPYSIDHRVVLRDGAVRHVQEQAEFAFDSAGEAVSVIGTLLDVTARKQAEERLAHLAHHDALTGLPNRTLLYERLSQALLFARRHSSSVAVLYLDLDRFKSVNDTLGHGVGDDLLKVVAARLAGAVRPTDTVVRPGGDEFIIVLADMARDTDAKDVAEKIGRTFAAPFVVNGDDLFVSTSIGVARFPKDGDDAETLIKNADAAMYQAKERGRNNTQFYTADIQDATRRKLSLEGDLRKALERQEFVLHYQPIVSVTTGAIAGFESLVRWQHPQRGLIAPNDFIPLAEEVGLIVPLGDWVLRTAAAQQKEWERNGCDVGRVTVNISARQFQQRDLPAVVGRIVDELGILPGTLELELTESIVMRDVVDGIRAVTQLREMGVGVAMDDFGTGYSSLSYLKSFPIASLKIDGSFIRDLTVDPFDEAISQAIVTLARSLQVRVVAEGVETQAQLLKLRRMGCDEAQGFYFSKAVTASETLELFDRFRRREARPGA